MPRQYLTAGIIFCLIVSFACQAALGADPKRVLIIDSFGRDFAPWNEYAKRFRADLDRQWSEPMPFVESKSLTNDEVYAVSAYILNLNEIIGKDDVLDAQSLPKVRMPNRDGFIPFPRSPK